MGLPGIILQGTVTLAFAIREIINREADRDATRLRSLFCRFTGMVLPGTMIRVILERRIEAPAGRELYYTVFNQEGKKAISGGYVFLNRAGG